MALAGTKFYLQGFCIENTKTSVQINQSLFENSITSGSKVVISFKPGATTNDFLGILPSGITIVEDRKLSQFRITKLEPIVFKLNQHSVECYDLENRVLNYLVSEDRETFLLETSHHTAMILQSEDVDNEVTLRSITDNSLYFKFLTVPLGETFSYPVINTHSSYSEFKSEYSAPLYFSKYTKYRMEYSKALLGFYNQLKLILPDFEIYLEGSRMKNTDNIDSNRIVITLEGLGDLERRPHMLDKDLHQSAAYLNLKIQTSDQLKYMHIKNAYQNLTLLSNLARFTVLDSRGLSWMSHVEWEPVKDNTRMKEIRDEEGRFAHNLDLRCALYFYVVTDDLYHVIQVIDINYIITTTGISTINIPSQVTEGNPNSQITQGGLHGPTTIINNNVTQVDEWDTLNW